MRRICRERWKRERQRRFYAKRCKYHSHRRRLAQKPRAILASALPSKDEVPYLGLVNSPRILSLLKDVKNNVRFFSNIRSQARSVKKKRIKCVTLNIDHIVDIDLPTTMVLSALGRELGGQKVSLRGNFPSDGDCRDFFIKTGFLNDKVNSKGVKFNKSEKTDYININKGQGKLRVEDTMMICQIVRHACEHLGRDDFYDDVVSIIKEIAGNSIEWSKSFRDQWTLGVMLEDNRVVFSILDLGKGILDTISRKFINKLKGIFESDVDFLGDVFDKQYSSSSNEENRYKGLPSIKKAYLDGKIQNLTVMTNNVLMRFADSASSVQFSESRQAFNGTLYYWEILKRDETVNSN